MEKIKIYTTRLCIDCQITLKFLENNSIPYDEINVSGNLEAQTEVKKINNGNASVPTLIFEDGSTLTEPTNQDLIEKLGL